MEPTAAPDEAMETGEEELPEPVARPQEILAPVLARATQIPRALRARGLVGAKGEYPL